jgi:hypothetical protein
MCNPDAIMTHPVSILSLCFSPVSAGHAVGSRGATSKMHSFTENGQQTDPSWLCRNGACGTVSPMFYLYPQSGQSE